MIGTGTAFSRCAFFARGKRALQAREGAAQVADNVISQAVASASNKGNNRLMAIERQILTNRKNALSRPGRARPPGKRAPG